MLHASISGYLVFGGSKNKKNGPGYTCMQLCPDILACKFKLTSQIIFRLRKLLKFSLNNGETK